MITLEKAIKLQTLQESVNLATDMSDDDLTKIGHNVVDLYDADEASRLPWKKKNKDAISLALQIVEEKSSPWQNAANIKFPLLTLAALQFASRAYPALVKAPDLVKFRVQGKDAEGLKAARAHRISRHMSYQLLEQDESWEEEQDKAYMALPILGCVFKKSYYDPTLDHNCSECVLPMNLSVHYYAKSLEKAERKTHIFPLSERAIRERVLKGIYIDHELSPMPMQSPKDEDNRQGIMPPTDDDIPRNILEQHAYMDFDGDGYAEPYVLTVDQESRKVFRIVSRFKKVITEQSLEIEKHTNRMRELSDAIPQPTGEETEKELELVQRVQTTLQELQARIEMLKGQKPKVLRIDAVEHFTKIPFIPAPDGGFYDIGFGALLSPLNESVNTIINQLVDAGTLQNGSVGFIGKGARIKGGVVRFSPNEWKRVDVAGATLRDSLVPLPVNQPSAVLFQLLGLLISYTERVSSVTDTMTGENPGQNTPAYNMSAMLEQGMQVFNGIFKRVYRAFRSELRKLYDLNAIYMDYHEYFEYLDDEGQISREDYTADVKDLIPAADPNAFSSKEKQAKAQMVSERAQMVPGYDMIKVEQAMMEAADIPNAAELFPVYPDEETGEMRLKFEPPEDPELALKGAEEARRTKEAEDRAKVNMMLASAKLAESEARIVLIYAQAEQAADAPEMMRIKAMLDDLKDQRKTLLEMAKIENDEDSLRAEIAGMSDEDLEKELGLAS